MKTINKYIVLVFCSLALISCDNNRVFDSYKSVGNGWHRDSLVVFEYEVQDTVKPYDLFLTLRANNDYPFSNIFVIASLESPSGETKTDTLEYLMAAPDGTLLGNGFSDIKESKLWLKDDYKFSQKGKHVITIEQALRKRNEVEGVEVLEGISEVGLRIENNNN
jgi:gliding motility-associated lipoprotein GldH